MWKINSRKIYRIKYRLFWVNVWNLICKHHIHNFHFLPSGLLFDEIEKAMEKRRFMFYKDTKERKKKIKIYKTRKRMHFYIISDFLFFSLPFSHAFNCYYYSILCFLIYAQYHMRMGKMKRGNNRREFRAVQQVPFPGWVAKLFWSAKA